MERNIQHRFFFPNTPEDVWEYLTRSELIAEWLMENNFRPEVGYEFQFNTKPIIKLGFDGKIYCKVLEIVPLKKLSYSWKGGHGEKINLDTVITWTLIPTNNGTELQLKQTGFKGAKNFMAYFFMNIGWIKIGKRFHSLLNTATHGTTNA